MTPLKTIVTLSLIATAPPTISAMTWNKRVLLIAAPDNRDPALARQRHILARWQAGAAERDLGVVEVVGGGVSGASDSAAALRRRFALPSDRFTVVLIGKDGGVKLRQRLPLPATRLEETIDAMPMRRNGER